MSDNRYTDEAELKYLRFTEYHLPYFAPGELCKVENYGEALKARFIGWHLHHRLEINPDGSAGKSRGELIAEDLYYQRPADELQFLRVREHRRMHMVGKVRKPGTPASDDTRRKQSEAKLESNNTEERYRVVKSLVDSDSVLSATDYAFYRRYCLRNGLDFSGARIDKTGTVKRVDIPKKSRERGTDRASRQKARYDAIMIRIVRDNRLHKRDIMFLRRYCEYNELAMPRVVMAWTGSCRPYELEFTES